jgi:serine/threonine-protein kinase
VTDGEGSKKDDAGAKPVANPAAKAAPFKIPPIPAPSNISSPSIQISVEGKPLNVRLPTVPPVEPSTDDDWDLPAADPAPIAESPASTTPSGEAKPIDLSGMSSPKWPVAPADPQDISAVFVDTDGSRPRLDSDGADPTWIGPAPGGGGRVVRDTEGDQLYFARAAGARTDEHDPIEPTSEPAASYVEERQTSVPVVAAPVAKVQVESTYAAVQAPPAYVPPPQFEPEPSEPILATGSGEKPLDAPSAPSAPAIVMEMDADAAPVRRLGNYDILQLIGSGGMAEVFLARSRGLAGFEKIVVLKRIHAHLAREPQFVNMFLDEARLAARINDPHVVQIYELGEADGTYFMTMEYLAGESLSTIVKRAIRGGPALPVAHVARVVADAATGLHAAHELRDSRGRPLEVVHRDVSHGNIVILYSGGVKVLDFGVAKARDSLNTTQVGERKGKFGYMSPEQVIGEPLDRRSDVFSLGVVLWEALTRQSLFSAETEQAAMRRVLEGVPPPPSKLRPEVPPALDQIVLRALHKDRRHRYQTAEEMSGALETFLTTQPTGARELSAFMKSAFPDRIEQRAKLLQIGNDGGEPMPQASIKHTESKVMASDQAVARLEMLRRRNRRALIVGGIAIPILLAVAFYLGRKRDQEKAAAAQPVTATVTAPPPDAAVPQTSLADATFDRAEIALRNNRIAAPPGDNALELILEGEQLEPKSPRAKVLREQSIAQLLAVADTLWTNGKLDSARSIYSDVLLFDSEHELARMRRAGMKLAPAPKSGDADQSQVSWLVSEIDLAIIERRLVEPARRNALDMLIQLRKLDPKGNATRRLGTDVAKALRGEAKEAKPADAKELLEAAKVATGEKTATEPAKPPEDEGEKPRNPALAQDYVAKGNAQLGAGQLGEARKSFERAISADSAAHGALAGIAEVAYNESDFTRAVLAAKRAIGLAPNSVSYRMLLAKAYYKLLRYEDAIKQWKRVLQLDRTNAAAQKNIEMAQRRMGQ